MKPSAFQYYAPRTIGDALATLAKVAPEDGRVIAGGQSLVPAMALRLAQPAHLVDINGLSELERLQARDGVLSIGACVRHAAFERSVVDGPLGRLLANVARHIAHYPIRTRGTFCGSIANADPASEWCLVAAALGATMIACSSRGERTFSASDFFQGIMTTALAADELLTEVRLPLLSANTRCGFNEFSRRAGDFAIAMALATYCIHEGVIVEPCVGVGGVEARPRRIAEAEAILSGNAPSATLFADAAECASTVVQPIDASDDAIAYKRDVTRAVVQRALEAAEQAS